MTDKAFIDAVTLTTGEIITLSVPTMGQIYQGLILDRKPWMEVIVPAATKKTWKWYLDLSLLDGAVILMKLAPTMKAMNDMVEAMSVAASTKH